MKLKALAALLALAPAAAFVAAPPAAAAEPALTCTTQVFAFAPGFQAFVTVRNTAAVPFTNWHITFQLAPAATIGSSFGGTISRSGSAGIITPAVYFATIQPGGQAGLGFGGSAVPFTPPTAFTLNGVPCGVTGW